MTQRNENSVLFSLGHLQQMALASAGQSRFSTPAPAVRTPSSGQPFTSGGVQEPSVPHDLDEIVDHLCQLAGRLSELERSQMALNDTVNMAVSDTMPLDAK